MGKGSGERVETAVRMKRITGVEETGRGEVTADSNNLRCL